jgi:uncharacterized protein YkwD
MRCLFVVVCLGSVFWTTSEGAATDEFSTYEAALVEKINWARQNPAQAAHLVGMTNTLNDALNALQENSVLTAAALTHSLEMAENHYYGYTSLDGKSPEVRISETGYDASLMGEMIGLVTFRNYMPPETAVGILFKQLLKRDLQQSGTGGNTYIFNPAMAEIGVALTAGRVEIGAGSYNGYILTCDFGAPAPEPHYGAQNPEFLFIELMNRMRTEPVETLSEFGIDAFELAEERPELAKVITIGTIPVAYAPSFRKSAFSRNRDAFNTLFSGPADGLVFVSSANYCAELISDCFAISGEISAGFQDSREFTASEVVHNIFEKLLIQDLAAEDLSEMFLLNPDIQEISVVFAQRKVNYGGKLVQQYVLTDAYGYGYLSLMEKQSLNLLNQARAAANTKNSDSPENSEAPETDRETEVPKVQNVEETTSPAVPILPLTPNHLIYTSADQHAKEMIEKAYFDTYSYDGTLDLGERLSLLDYYPLAYHEEISMASDEITFDVETVAANMFDDLLVVVNDIITNSDNLFSPDMKEAGIRILYSQPVTVEGNPEQEEQELIGEVIPEPDLNSFQRLYTLLIVVDVAAPEVDTSEGVVVVLVFEDTNLNGQYDRGEELAAAPVEIFSEQDQMSYRFYTDSAGSLSLPLKDGIYELKLAETDESKVLTVEMGNDNKLVTFLVEPVMEPTGEDKEAASVNDSLLTGVDEKIVNIN